MLGFGWEGEPLRARCRGSSFRVELEGGLGFIEDALTF